MEGTEKERHHGKVTDPINANAENMVKCLSALNNHD